LIEVFKGAVTLETFYPAFDKTVGEMDVNEFHDFLLSNLSMGDGLFLDLSKMADYAGFPDLFWTNLVWEFVKDKEAWQRKHQSRKPVE